MTPEEEVDQRRANGEAMTGFMERLSGAMMEPTEEDFDDEDETPKEGDQR
jgi:hypothetical protein